MAATATTSVFVTTLSFCTYKLVCLLCPTSDITSNPTSNNRLFMVEIHDVVVVGCLGISKDDIIKLLKQKK